MSKNGKHPPRQRVIIVLKDTEDEQSFEANFTYEPGIAKRKENSPSLNAAIRLQTLFETQKDRLVPPLPGSPDKPESKIITPEDFKL